jgi:hypothetical protein
MAVATSDQDWQKEGYMDNSIYGVKQNPVTDHRLLPFQTPCFPYNGANSVKTFTLRRISRRAGIKTVLETINLFATDPGLVLVTVDSSRQYIHFPALYDFKVDKTGVFEYYIEDQFTHAYVSEPFMIDTLCGSITILGDLDPLDFNNDFFKTV